MQRRRKDKYIHPCLYTFYSQSRERGERILGNGKSRNKIRKRGKGGKGRGEKDKRKGNLSFKVTCSLLRIVYIKKVNQQSRTKKTVVDL